MTIEELEVRSATRARANHRRFVVLAVFVVVVFFVLASLLQVQQTRLQTFVHQQCQQRRVNVLRSNEIWAELAVIEEHNQFVNDQIRQERLNVYQNAKLTVPVCD